MLAYVFRLTFSRYLARWAMGIAEQSEKERNQRIWTAKDVLEMEDSEVGEFELLDMERMNLSDKRKPVTLKEWNGYFNSSTGKLEKTPDEVKERIFHGGLASEDGVRKEAWLFLLGVYDWESTKVSIPTVQLCCIPEMRPKMTLGRPIRGGNGSAIWLGYSSYGPIASPLLTYL